MSIREKFIELFEVWSEVTPFIDRIVTPEEQQLIVIMSGQALPVSEIAIRTGLSATEVFQQLERAYGRHLVNKEMRFEGDYYEQADFAARLDHFVKFENWDAIPLLDRQRIDERFLEIFIERHRGTIECKKRGLTAQDELPNDVVLLLSETFSLVDAATLIVVQPCDCRRLAQNCTRPVQTCILLDDIARETLARGHGQQLNSEQAKQLLRWCDQKGLIHTSDAAWQVHGLTAICNCCECCCYPFQAARKLDSKGVWPKNRYCAEIDHTRCQLCGACVKRCHFEAFRGAAEKILIKGKYREKILFEPDCCWGCGLCATSCPEQAITMIPL
ncbi:ATP-binding protein [candidate division CSSED10-310 bacterium]|uniref:ATP-binding protein n=1 Tax=candidate division CSSED10-310 bacterium TaxID=2855610 RepID=A0ABV6YX63_UNCC1